ncbi:GNAT family N-acetyltransferase [Actinospica durhamensis]|uniref:GNAT family N-acetyltransferase n=1 Tax=Actinospica durhamensis TaxID=1508375 RepID=A0A941F037_9ACTN|nr:GNAT family N-acetyltransferase [Actinospica durhamensis]MBR7837664.1 GNAT family N-acetyltransferase [Actinospica durhamensis]
MPTKTSVRPAAASDVPALLSLYAELHPTDPPVAPERVAEVWQHIAAQTGRTILVAELGGDVVGTVDCALLPNLTRGARPYLVVENVVVAERVRRQGVGTALFDAVTELAQQTHSYKIQLISASKNEGTHAFYRALGLEPRAQGYRRYL